MQRNFLHPKIKPQVAEFLRMARRDPTNYKLLYRDGDHRKRYVALMAYHATGGRGGEEDDIARGLVEEVIREAQPAIEDLPNIG